MKRAAALVLVWFCASCASVPKRGPEPSDADKTLRHDILASLAVRDASLRGLRGLATVRYGSKLMGVQGDTAFALRRPADLRVDALSDFGSFASQVIFTKDRLLVLWPAEGQYYLGAADREAMERFLLIGLEPEEVVDVILGIVPVEAEGCYRVVKTGARDVVLRGQDGELTVRRVGGHFVPSRYVGRDEKRELLYEVSYDAFRESGGQIFPESLRARFREPRSQIEIRFKEIELNPKWGRNVFEQKIPDNAVPLTE